MKKLSPTQQRAYEKLTDEWTNAYRLGERLNTLRALVDRGLATSKAGLGASYSPSTVIKFKRLGEIDEGN